MIDPRERGEGDGRATSANSVLIRNITFFPKNQGLSVSSCHERAAVGCVCVARAKECS